MKTIIRQPYSFCQLGQRSNQEDARFPDSDAPSAYRRGVFAVCDGVGGLEKGELASRTVADALGRAMEDFDPGRVFTADDFSKVLSVAFDALEDRIRAGSKEMATTMTFLCLHRGGAFVAHIGDSRIYQFRPGVGIMYRSDDHSLVNALVHSGNITPEEAIDHPQSNVITRCMGYVGAGARRPSATTLQIPDVEPGDYFFLCTDGVTHCLDDAALFQIVGNASLTDREKMEIIARRSSVSHDNNTAFLVAVDAVEYPDDGLSGGDRSEAPARSSTTPIHRPVEQVREVDAGRPSVRDRITGFIKSLFG